jgi:hypothetical protein
MTDSPEMQKLLQGLKKAKADIVKDAMSGYNRGVVDGLDLAIVALGASRKEAEGSEYAAGLDLAIQTLSLSLELAKMETGQ